MKTFITFIRHGESVANVNHKMYYYPDYMIGLTEKGILESHMLRNKVYIQKDRLLYTKILSSEFERAKQTARIFNNGLPVESDARLNEVFFCMESLSLTEYRQQILDRIKSVVDSYPFDLILFCHGQFMEYLEPDIEPPLNGEVRTYERNTFAQVLSAAYESDKPIIARGREMINIEGVIIMLGEQAWGVTYKDNQRITGWGSIDSAQIFTDEKHCKDVISNSKEPELKKGLIVKVTRRIETLIYTTIKAN